MPTVPVKVGLDTGALFCSAARVNVEIGLSASAVLLALPNPIIVGVIPFTVPVKVAPVKSAFPLSDVAKLVPFNVIAGAVNALPVPITILPAND